MSLIATKGTEGGDYKPVPEGQYIARCFRLIDLGRQEEEWKGEKKLRAKVQIYWELLDGEKQEDGSPFVITKRYTNSLSEKSDLYADLIAWRGRNFTETELDAFDLTNILGVYCQLQIVHKPSKDGSKTYSNIQGLMAFKGDKKPAAVNETLAFDIDAPEMEVFGKLSDSIKQTIQKSPDWQGELLPTATEAAVATAPDITPTDEEVEKVNLDDIPF